MTRQQGFKRARTLTKIHRDVDQNESDDNQGILEDKEAHPSTKKVRWDNRTDESGVNNQEDSDDEPGGSQNVRSI
jgi:hypothetical protein